MPGLRIVVYNLPRLLRNVLRDTDFESKKVKLKRFKSFAPMARKRLGFRVLYLSNEKRAPSCLGYMDVSEKGGTPKSSI